MNKHERYDDESGKWINMNEVKYEIDYSQKIICWGWVDMFRAVLRMGN